MTGVQNGHVILLGHLVNGIEEAHEVLLRVDVLLAVSGEQDILVRLKPQLRVESGELRVYFLKHLTTFNLREVIVQHLCHRATGHVGAFLGQTRIGQIATGMLAIGHVHITDDIHDAAVGLLGQTFVLTTVTGLHVEDGDVQALGADDAQAAVGVTQHQHGIRLHLHHQLVALGDDITHRLTQVIAYSLHIHVWVFQLQVLEEHAVQVIVVVLTCVRQQGIKVLAALVNNRCQSDYFGSRSNNNK